MLKQLLPLALLAALGSLPARLDAYPFSEPIVGCYGEGHDCTTTATVEECMKHCLTVEGWKCGSLNWVSHEHPDAALRGQCCLRYGNRGVYRGNFHSPCGEPRGKYAVYSHYLAYLDRF